MRRRVDHLSDSGHRDDRPDTARAAGDRDRLARRLRDLPANHPSAASVTLRARGDSNKTEKDQESASPADHDLPASRGLDALAQRFWSKTGHFDTLWRSHQERWPRPHDQDRKRPDDPDGSWRGDGGRHLTPDENVQAEDAIAVLQKCEPEVTDLLRRLEQESPFGARLVGLEHRLKGADRLKEKIVDTMKASPGIGVAEAASQISDAVRFTYCIEPGMYSPGYADMCARMRSAECQMLPSKNFWQGEQDYRGINSRWTTPAGARFELQFHTAESHYAKEFLTHGSYGRLRSPETSRAERRALNAYQALVCEVIPVPPGVSDVGDTRNSS